MNNQAHQDKLQSIIGMDAQQRADEAEIVTGQLARHKAIRDRAGKVEEEINAQIRVLAEKRTDAKTEYADAQMGVERSLAILYEIEVQSRPVASTVKVAAE